MSEEIRNLKIEKMKLENAISYFRANNETSIKIKQMVRQEIGRFATTFVVINNSNDSYLDLAFRLA